MLVAACSASWLQLSQAIACSGHNADMILELLGKNLCHEVEWSAKTLAPGQLASISDVLQTATTLREIDISGAMLGADDCDALAAALPHLPMLSSLELENVGMTDQCAHALALALPSSATLRVVDVESNPELGSAGVIALVVAAQESASIVKLDLAGCSAEDDVADTVKDWLVGGGVGTVLRNVDLRRNRLSQATADELFQQVRPGNNLRRRAKMGPNATRYVKLDSQDQRAWRDRPAAPAQRVHQQDAQIEDGDGDGMGTASQPGAAIGNPLEWTAAETATWVGSLSNGLKRRAPALVEHDVDFATLMELTDDDLRELGFDVSLSRKRLRREMAALASALESSTKDE